MSRLTPCPWIKLSSTNITNQIFFEMLRKKNLFQNVEKEQSISKCWERSVKRKPNLNFSRVIKNSYFDQHWAIPEKIQTGRVGAGGGEDIEFPQRYWRKIMWKFQGQLKKKWNSQGCSRTTHMEFPWNIWPWNFQGVSQILQNFQGESLFSQEFLKGISGKSENSKRVFFRKVYPQTPLFRFFLE